MVQRRDRNIMSTYFVLQDRQGFTLGDLGQLAITRAIRPEAGCLRLLCGTCEIKNIETEQTTEVKINYLKSPTWENSEINLNFLDEYQEGLTGQDYNNYLKQANDRNRDFYQELLDEIIVATYAAETENGILSFLHTYRAYERIAYAFPMIYASKSRDYLGSFNELRGWMADKNGDGSVGELGFLKKYIEAVYDDNQKKATMDLLFLGSDRIRSCQFSLIKNKILKWNKNNFTTDATIENQVLSVPFNQLHTLLLTIRNRYFHQMSGRTDNIKRSEIIDPETFFNVLSAPMLSYVATLFHDVLIREMDRTV